MHEGRRRAPGSFKGAEIIGIQAATGRPGLTQRCLDIHACPRDDRRCAPQCTDIHQRIGEIGELRDVPRTHFGHQRTEEPQLADVLKTQGRPIQFGAGAGRLTPGRSDTTEEDPAILFRESISCPPGKVQGDRSP